MIHVIIGALLAFELVIVVATHLIANAYTGFLYYTYHTLSVFALIASCYIALNWWRIIRDRNRE